MKHQNHDLQNFRSTQSLTLPDSWRVGALSHGRFSLCHQFHPIEDESAAIIVSSRGYNISDQLSERFKKILSTPPHTLDDLERQRIAEVLDNQSLRARFSLTSARTEVWQGKMVLVTEGTYVSNGDRAFTLFVDAQGDGSWIEEFQYSAPSDSFSLHFPDAMAAFKSISWQAGGNA